MKIFLDSCILFGAVEDRKLERLLHRCRNMGHELHTSISVIGETVALCLEEHRRDELHEIIEICEALDIHYGHGWYEFGKIHETVIGHSFDHRIQPNDFIHICHAYYLAADAFLTTDRPIHDNRSIGEILRVLYPDELRMYLAGQKGA